MKFKNINRRDVNSAIKAELVEDISFRDLYEKKEINDLRKLKKNNKHNVGKIIHFNKNQEKGVAILVKSDNTLRRYLFDGKIPSGTYFHSFSAYLGGDDDVQLCKDKETLKKVISAFEDIKNYTNDKKYDFANKDFNGLHESLFAGNGNQIINKSKTEKLKKNLLEKIEDDYKSLKKQREKPSNTRKKGPDKIEDVKDNETWTKEGLYRVGLKDRYSKFDMLEINGDTYRNKKRKILTSNRCFNSFIDYFDIGWDLERALKNGNLKPFFKLIWDKYDGGLGKNTKITYHNPKGFNFEFTFKKDGNGIYFFDERVRKNKFKQILGMLLNKIDKSKDKLVNKIEFYNKFSGVRRKMMDVEKITVGEILTKNKTKLDVEFKVEDKDNWKIEIAHKEFDIKWTTLKDHFVYGKRKIKIGGDSISKIKTFDFYKFISDISDSPFEDYKEIMLMSNI